jgi:ABC-type antimicrobial peptide transport system permease subunit
MAFAILIGLWIQYELSVDGYNLNKDRIALVLKNTFFNNEKNTQDATPMPLYYELKANHPEVKHASRLSWNSDYSLSVGDKKLKRQGRFVDPDFLEMFTMKPLKGNLKAAFSDNSAMVITESLAKALFGTTDAIGKTIKLNNDALLHVTAVIKDIPVNSTVRYDFLAPYEFLVEKDDFKKNNRDNWGNNFLMNVLELKEGVSMGRFSQKIKHLNTEKDKSLKDLFLFLHPMSKWNLRNEYKNWVNTGGKYEYVKLFAIIGLFVLLIACINFMNLSTARSEKRAKEVGIRKAIGSLRKQLISQFLTETLLTALLAFVVAMIMIPVILPYLKDLGFENIRFDVSNIYLLLSVFFVAIITGFIAGSYPAFYLSSFAPVKVLKGIFKQGQGTVIFRRVLVVSQFAISIGLIISTIIIFRQINHARNRSLGYDPNNLINVSASKEIVDNYVALKQDLLNTGYVEAVTKTSNPLTGIYNSWSDFDWTGKDPASQIAIDAIMTEWDYEKTVGLKFVQGRPFSREFKTDSNGVILNESALKLIGYKDPVGKTMKVGGRTLNIVGIVEDMLIQNPFKPVHPAAILFDANTVNFVFIRLKEKADLQSALAAIQPIFERHNPAYPFEFSFSDQEFEQKFIIEKQVAKLAAIFAVLAIFISCLGLFGLAAFMAERRTKEIGIRKVLGASVMSLWTLLSKEFVWLVLAGCVIATPLSFWLMSNWLLNYDYRINISWWIFAIAALCAIVIALVTVSAQAVKAAVGNPLKSLRSE